MTSPCPGYFVFKPVMLDPGSRIPDRDWAPISILDHVQRTFETQTSIGMGRTTLPLPPPTQWVHSVGDGWFRRILWSTVCMVNDFIGVSSS